MTTIGRIKDIPDFMWIGAMACAICARKATMTQSSIAMWVIVTSSDGLQYAVCPKCFKIMLKQVRK